MFLNIEERKRTEQALRESELRFRTVFQTSPDAVTLSRLDDGLMIEVNEGFTRLSKYSKQEIKGRTSLDINIWHDPKDREKMIDWLQEDGQLENFEAEFKRKDDQVITGLLSTKVIMLNAEPLRPPTNFCRLPIGITRCVLC
jgi:PAS domain S-box-containing protein